MLGMKYRPHVLLAIFLIVFSIQMMALSDINLKGQAITEETRTYSNQWKITDWNESSLLYWYPRAYVNATIGSLLNFTVNLPNGTSSMPSEINGTIEIGNFTANVSNTEIASALTLSIWPWMPGLLVTPNWRNHTTTAEEAARGQFMNGSLIIKNVTYSEALAGSPREAIKFDYKQNSGFQETVLIYDRQTGVLLFAKTRAGNFKLELILLSSDFISDTTESPHQESSAVSSFDYFVTFIGFVAVFSLTIPKRKKN